MNTLKKTVAVVLAVAMVLTMGIATSFAAFPDVPSTANYAEAVNILTNLGIIKGADDGTFKPNNTITRAEVAAIMVRALNLEALPGTTVFTDVPENHWAAGEINAAYAAGVINGKGDGTFDPSGEVTYEQVLKMIVCALGYDLDAMSKGGWPQGYTTVASNLKITSGAGGNVGQPATRATVAKAVYNALEVDMMDQTSWGSDVNYAPKEGKTLLSNLDVIKAEAVVTDSYYTTAATDRKYDADDHNVTLTLSKALDENSELFTGDATDKTDVKNGDVTGVFDEGGTAAASMLGYSCVAYIGYDEDTDDPTIFAISAKSGKNSTTTVTSTQLADSEEGELNSDEIDDQDKDGVVFYWRNNSSDKRAASLTPDTDVKVFTNYADVTDASVAPADADVYDGTGRFFLEQIKDKGGVVTFIDNDNDKKFDVAMISKYTQEGVVESARVNSDGQYVFRGMTDSKNVPETYDPEDDEKLKIFLKGENYIDPSEIAVGDTITTIGDENDDVIIIYKVSSDKIEGRSSSYDSESDTLAVSGKSYAASPMYKVNLKANNNTTGIFYLNADGLISLIDGSSTATGEYGYMLAVADETKWGKTTYEVRILDAATAKVNTYNLRSSNLIVYQDAKSNQDLFGDDDATSSYRISSDDAALEMLYAKLQDITADKSAASAKDRVIKYNVENNEISRITFAGNYLDGGIEYASITDRAYDADERTIGKSDPFTDNTYVFVVKANNDEPDYSDDDDITVIKGGRFVDRSTYSVETFSENDVVAAAVQESTESDVDQSQGVFVVSNVTVEVNDDNENIVTFQGIQEGSNRTFSLYDDAKGYADDIASGTLSLAKGTVMLVGPVVNGFVDTVEFLAFVERPNDRNKTGKITTADTRRSTTVKYNGDEYYWDIAQLNPIVDGDEDVYMDDNDGIDIDGYSNGPDQAYYRVRNNTNVTLVDYSGARYANASVTSKDIDVVDVDPNKYTFFVLFRVSDVDDMDTLAGGDLDSERSNVTDLVVFKMANDSYQFELDGAAPISYEGSSGTNVKPLDNDKDLDNSKDLEADNGTSGSLTLN